jgi:hypothetical protein
MGQYLGGWTPWHYPTDFPAGAAFRMPAGARIAIDVLHGSAPPPQPPRVGVYVTNDAPHVLDVVRVVGETRAGERRVRASEPLPAGRTIVGVRVEMTDGAQSIEVNARRPDGVFEPLVWIKDFRQDWQVPFVLKSPVVLPAGSVVHATSYFTDSTSTPARATVHLLGY